MMYFIKVQALSEKLKKNTLTEKEKFTYLLIPIILDISVITLNTGIQAILKVITIVGISWCYIENSMGDNKDFIVRYTCLSWPITFILFLVSFTLWITTSRFHILKKDDVGILVLGVYIARYIWTWWEIKKISRNKIDMII